MTTLPAAQLPESPTRPWRRFLRLAGGGLLAAALLIDFWGHPTAATRPQVAPGEQLVATTDYAGLVYASSCRVDDTCTHYWQSDFAWIVAGLLAVLAIWLCVTSVFGKRWAWRGWSGETFGLMTLLGVMATLVYPGPAAGASLWLCLGAELLVAIAWPWRQQARRFYAWMATSLPRSKPA